MTDMPAGCIPNAESAKREMLDFLGLAKISDLFEDIPESIRLNRPLNLPPGKSEMETMVEMRRLAGRNKAYGAVFRGAGAYRHYIPAIVKRIAAKDEFLTAYTPYQPELSQGVLQYIYEFQTMICELTGMEAANASVYDGAVAAAEAVAMCRVGRRRRVLISETVHPQTIGTVATYCKFTDSDIEVIPHVHGLTDIDAIYSKADCDTSCVYIQQPNFFGLIEDARAIGAAAKERGAMYIMGANPIALALVASPGECGADVAVGEGQPLGLPLSFGGPYLGYMACKWELLRKLPGRIVGKTSDKRGERAFVLTLQAREQHIRREKASSNICTNQAHCALTAAAYMSAMGHTGMRGVAERCMANAAYLRNALARIKGYEPVFDGLFFNEFVTRCPVPPERLELALEARGMLAGLPLNGSLDGCILWCATECNTKAEMDFLAEIAEGCAG
jgi:glycine dehydrogenase subunit 1